MCFRFLPFMAVQASLYPNFSNFTEWGTPYKSSVCVEKLAKITTFSYCVTRNRYFDALRLKTLFLRTLERFYRLVIPYFLGS